MWKTAENSIFILGGSATKLSIKQPEPVLLKVLSSAHFSNSYVDPLYLGSIVVFFVRGEDNHWKSEIAAMEIKMKIAGERARPGRIIILGFRLQ